MRMLRASWSIGACGSPDPRVVRYIELKMSRCGSHAVRKVRSSRSAMPSGPASMTDAIFSIGLTGSSIVATRRPDLSPK